jgi:hypothetical protein
MSIKIYEARRVPISRFGEATDLLHDLLSEAFYKVWASKLDFMLNSKPQVVDVDWMVEAENRIQKLRDRSPFCFDSSHSYGFDFWLDAEYAYLIPYGRGGLPYPDWMEDYHYQDQTDMDPDVEESRLAKWNELLLQNPKDRRYRHSVVDPSEGFYMAFSSYSLRWFNLHKS